VRQLVVDDVAVVSEVGLRSLEEQDGVRVGELKVGRRSPGQLLPGLLGDVRGVVHAGKPLDVDPAHAELRVRVVGREDVGPDLQPLLGVFPLIPQEKARGERPEVVVGDVDVLVAVDFGEDVLVRRVGAVGLRRRIGLGRAAGRVVVARAPVLGIGSLGQHVAELGRQGNVEAAVLDAAGDLLCGLLRVAALVEAAGEGLGEGALEVAVRIARRCEVAHRHGRQRRRTVLPGVRRVDLGVVRVGDTVLERSNLAALRVDHRVEVLERIERRKVHLVREAGDPLLHEEDLAVLTDDTAPVDEDSVDSLGRALRRVPWRQAPGLGLGKDRRAGALHPPDAVLGVEGYGDDGAEDGLSAPLGGEANDMAKRGRDDVGFAECGALEAQVLRARERGLPCGFLGSPALRLVRARGVSPRRMERSDRACEREGGEQRERDGEASHGFSLRTFARGGERRGF
jgi:hypothetical protein